MIYSQGIDSIAAVPPTQPSTENEGEDTCDWRPAEPLRASESLRAVLCSGNPCRRAVMVIAQWKNHL